MKTKLLTVCEHCKIQFNEPQEFGLCDDCYEGYLQSNGKLADWKKDLHAPKKSRKVSAIKINGFSI